MVGIVWNLGAKLWDILPENVKIDSLKYLKKKQLEFFLIFYLCQNSIILILYNVEINK